MNLSSEHILNPYVKQVLDQAEERFSVDSLNMAMSEWVSRNTTMLGRPFGYKGYEFQRQIMDDMSQDLDCIKISQVGMTEIQLRKMLGFLKRNRGTKGIFSLPDDAMHEKISVSRLKPIIEGNKKVFNTKYDIENKVTRTKEIKQFGESFLFIVAALEKAATSIDADIVMNDEVDLSDQAMIGLFTSRTQGSKWRIHQRFSTPSFPGFGIDANFATSDQHLYKVRCDGCGMWNHPEFTPEHIHMPGVPDHIEHYHDLTFEIVDGLDLREAFVCCTKCRSRLDLSDPSKREWVSMFPSRVNSRGYRITPFVSDRLDIPYILKQLLEFRKQEYIRGWHNTVLGRAYSDDTIQVSEDMVRGCFTDQMQPETGPVGDYWMGIDVGKTCHIVIGKGPNADNIVEMLTVNVHQLVDKVKELMEKYPIRAGSIDRHPYEPTANEVFEASGGVILPVEYRGTKNVNIIYKPGPEDTKILTHGQVNRTWFLDQLINKIRKKKLTISGYRHHKEVFVQHMRAMARTEKKGEPAEWTKLSENDHYFHAAAFMTLAPYIAELIQLNSKEEVRSMVLGLSANMSNSVESIAGVGKKRLEGPLGRG